MQRKIGSHRPAELSPLIMVKVLLLQQWYHLSDPQREAARWDHLSFRRFVGLELAEASPHYATISRFRQQLTAHVLAAALFAELRRQRAAHGLVVQAGTPARSTTRPGVQSAPATRVMQRSPWGEGLD